MTPTSPEAGLLRDVRQQGEGAPPTGGVRTRLVGGTYVAGKIKFQIWHLFIGTFAKILLFLY